MLTSDPCRHGGICVSQDGLPDRCECAPGYSGKFCSITGKDTGNLNLGLDGGGGQLLLVWAVLLTMAELDCNLKTLFQIP